ncbi:hypothetical protein [Actinoplanes sp. NPDC051494]|uniref:hypothetical protein n=1 Tax=Actinoplanes sp. NPDC051494 TaxID=3363907 RepID=UPI003787E261
MKAPAMSALAAWVALVIGLVNLWYSVGRAYFRERKASPAAQLDLLDFQTKTGWTTDVRIVITSHGPAVKQKVDVQAFDGDGMSLELTDPDVSALWPRMPFNRLHNGQSPYLTLSRGIETRDPSARSFDGTTGAPDSRPAQSTCRTAA